MIQEHKDILLKDLCARLPYYVKAEYYTTEGTEIGIIDGIYRHDLSVVINDNEISIFDIKPYLFPMSSMTEEQKNELREMEWSFDNSTICNIIECFGTYRAYVDHSCCSELIDWFYKTHIDYRGLISMGLALDATGLKIY